ncbi:DNA-binding transcriptional LysR family regulator [Bradyrhizobium diazoefficiens]|uniref:substrate-binding domain-containing protein n=1 Tax=Bradyrhizobium diazoefficiens TaxID=1355477 RepID=UPI00201320BF|nr:substrate-binding domain-containing protein [Bradyrhizobium diazoefficiens]WLA63406.1 substrate-binding domain-containing protein [Bradyrhizobium diazoefficiens]
MPTSVVSRFAYCSACAGFAALSAIPGGNAKSESADGLFLRLSRQKQWRDVSVITGHCEASPSISDLHRILQKLLVTMVQAGRGMAWLPESLIADQLASGELVKAGGPEWEIPIEIHVFRPRSRLTPAAEAFWKHVQEHPRPSIARKPVRSRRGRG